MTSKILRNSKLLLDRRVRVFIAVTFSSMISCCGRFGALFVCLFASVVAVAALFKFKLSSSSLISDSHDSGWNERRRVAAPDAHKPRGHLVVVVEMGRLDR